MHDWPYGPHISHITHPRVVDYPYNPFRIIEAKDHFVIVNWPCGSRVNHMVRSIVVYYAYNNIVQPWPTTKVEEKLLFNFQGHIWRVCAELNINIVTINFNRWSYYHTNNWSLFSFQRKNCFPLVRWIVYTNQSVYVLSIYRYSTIYRSHSYIFG